MKYSVIAEKFENSDKTIKLNKVKIAAASDWTPDKELRAGIIRGKAGKHDKDYVDVNGRHYKLRKYKKNRNPFIRSLGWVQLDTGLGVEYAMVQKYRIWPIILLILLCASLLAWKQTGVAPTDQPAYFADQANITNNNKDVHAAEITYSSYQSTPDQTWTAGSTEQKCELSLPADVNTKDTSGKEVSYSNPVMAAPHIYVDLNKDGQFSDDECVFNPMTKNDKGEVTDYGNMLKPGKMISDIQLTKALDAGEYDAETLWTGVTIEGHEVANPMTFKWHLTVK